MIFCFHLGSLFILYLPVGAFGWDGRIYSCRDDERTFVSSEGESTRKSTRKYKKVKESTKMDMFKVLGWLFLVGWIAGQLIRLPGEFPVTLLDVAVGAIIVGGIRGIREIGGLV